MRTKTQIFIATAFLLFDGIHAHAQNAVQLENPLVIAAPAAPNDQNFRKKFAQSIHKILVDSFTANAISKELGWSILKEEYFEATKTRETTFNMYKGWGNPKFSYQEKLDKKSFSAQLHAGYICLRSEDVIAEFGSTFKPTVWNVDSHFGGPPEFKSKPLSENIKRNQDLFSWGPTYQISAHGQTYRILFDFRESECATEISIYQPRK